MSKSDRKTLAVRVKAYRMERQFTQKRMAAFFEVSKPTYVRIEQGKGCSDLTKAKIEKLLPELTQQAVA